MTNEATMTNDEQSPNYEMTNCHKPFSSFRFLSFLRPSSFQPFLFALIRVIRESQSRAAFRFCFQRGLDGGAEALRAFVLGVQWLVIDEQGRSDLYSKGIAQRMIGIDSFSGFLAVHVLFELIKIKSDSSRVGFKQFPCIRSISPEHLFSIQHIIHLPEFALETRGFGGKCCLASVLVRREWKIPKDNPQARIVLLEKLFTKSSEAATGRALKIAKLFQRHRGIGVAANVDRFGLGR